MVWYSHLFKNFPQFVVIHTVKGFRVVNEADVFLEFSCFFYDPIDVGNLISGPSAFSKSNLYIWKFLATCLFISPQKCLRALSYMIPYFLEKCIWLLWVFVMTRRSSLCHVRCLVVVHGFSSCGTWAQ